MASDDESLRRIKSFYDNTYYRPGADDAHVAHPLSWHPRRIAQRLGDLKGRQVLDVACGRGEWLEHLHGLGCQVAGVDLSDPAVDHCRQSMPGGEFACSAAESLPFADGRFDLVTCLGSLEHFVNKPKALSEMRRVAKPDARFLLLVPNSGFLTRRLGLYRGTHQAQVREDVHSLAQWQALFSEAGLRVLQRWRDLHTLDRNWIATGRHVGARALRALQAVALPLWPLDWQYQVYFYCRRA